MVSYSHQRDKTYQSKYQLVPLQQKNVRMENPPPCTLTDHFMHEFNLVFLIQASCYRHISYLPYHCACRGAVSFMAYPHQSKTINIISIYLFVFRFYLYFLVPILYMGNKRETLVDTEVQNFQATYIYIFGKRMQGYTALPKQNKLSEVVCDSRYKG